MPNLPKIVLSFSFIFMFAAISYAAPEVTALPRPEIPLPQIDVKTYPQLLHAIRDVRSSSQQRIEQAVDQEKVREAWEMGKLIEGHILLNKKRAKYGDKVLIRLSKDVGSSEAELRYMLKFARTYPIHPPADELSWAHYRELLSLNSPTEREAVTKRAVREKWGRDRVRKEIRRRQSRAGKTESKPAPLPVPKLGKIFTYRVVKATAGPYQGRLALDLGFFNYYKPDNIKRFKEGSIVEVECEQHACIMKSIEEDVPEEDALYTYQAYVIDIIDGDTIEVVIDLGFDFTTVQQLRLRSLDAPEILSSDGKAAKALMEKILSRARDGGKILIKTSKREDQYGRYLVDIFLPSSLRGPQARGNPEYISINQELLDSGLLTIRDGE